MDPCIIGTYLGTTHSMYGKHILCYDLLAYCDHKCILLLLTLEFSELIKNLNIFIINKRLYVNTPKVIIKNNNTYYVIVKLIEHIIESQLSEDPAGSR